MKACPKIQRENKGQSLQKLERLLSTHRLLETKIGLETINIFFLKQMKSGEPTIHLIMPIPK